jgi:hypothetical protein
MKYLHLSLYERTVCRWLFALPSLCICTNYCISLCYAKQLNHGSVYSCSMGSTLTVAFCCLGCCYTTLGLQFCPAICTIHTRAQKSARLWPKLFPTWRYHRYMFLKSFIIAGQYPRLYKRHAVRSQAFTEHLHQQ